MSMTSAKHAENRLWAFQALDRLEGLVKEPGFEGAAETEQADIDHNRKELREGKYRVVFLGSFNVGKSALINALLGDEYLPTILEECTTKVVHIVRSETMKVVIDLSADATEGELEGLNNLIEAYGMKAAVEQDETGRRLGIAYEACHAQDLMNTLNTLVTVNAEEDFPQLRTLRSKFDELQVRLSTDLLEEDIALVDSPGVHSISDVNENIAERIIPDCHLVVCLIDSQSAGNQQSRDFIEKLVKQRHRKVFFVISKSDQLNDDEIDLQGRRGPAKDLFRSLVGIVETPELFFVSSLYALAAAQLSNKRIGIADLDKNKKIKIPFGVQEKLLQQEDPTNEVAAYLMEQSNLPAFKNRLLDYLYRENREGAILESVCRFLDAKAWSFVRPLQKKLELARNVPRLAELALERERLSAGLKTTERQKDEVLSTFKSMAAGETVDGVDYPGYAELISERLSEATVIEKVLNPLYAWLANPTNLKQVKQSGFSSLAREFEHELDTFTHDIFEEIKTEIEAVENVTLHKMRDALPEGLKSGRAVWVEMRWGRIGEMEVKMWGSYVLFTVAGTIIGAGVGAFAGGLVTSWAAAGITSCPVAAQFASFAPWLDPGTGMGIALGAVVGLAAGLLTRVATSGRALRRRLEAILRDSSMRILLRGSTGAEGEQAQSFLSQLQERVSRRRSQFATFIETQFDMTIADLAGRIDAVHEEEQALKRKQEEIVANLEPKIEMLTELGAKARTIRDEYASRPTP